MSWIAVNERLPEDDSTVLAATSDADYPVWLAYHEADGWMCADGFPIEVTHWMSLPEKP